jgi:hypothetical protein
MLTPMMWKVMRIHNGKIKEIGIADFAASPGTQITIEDQQFKVLFHEKTDDAGWVYVAFVSSPRLKQ